MFSVEQMGKRINLLQKRSTIKKIFFALIIIFTLSDGDFVPSERRMRITRRGGGGDLSFRNA